MQITCFYAVYMRHFCINIQFTAYNASSVYQVKYAQDFDDITGYIDDSDNNKTKLYDKQNGTLLWEIASKNNTTLELATPTTGIAAITPKAADGVCITDHGNFIRLNTTATGGRGGYSREDYKLSSVTNYTVEFDAALSIGNTANKSTYFYLETTRSANSNVSSNYLLSLSHTVTSGNTSNGAGMTTQKWDWVVNAKKDGSDIVVSLQEGVFYHFVVKVADSTATLAITSNTTGIDSPLATPVTLAPNGPSYTISNFKSQLGSGILDEQLFDNIVIYGN